MATDFPNDTEFSASVAGIENVLLAARQTMESPEVETLPYLATGTMGRILSSHRNSIEHADGPGGKNVGGIYSNMGTVVSFAGGRAGMQTAVRINSARS